MSFDVCMGHFFIVPPVLIERVSSHGYLGALIVVADLIYVMSKITRVYNHISSCS